MERREIPRPHTPPAYCLVMSRRNFRPHVCFISASVETEQPICLPSQPGRHDHRTNRHVVPPLAQRDYAKQ